MENKVYYKRIADKLLDLKLRAFGATNIVGPKWCGKTETAKQKAKSLILLQKQNNKEELEYSAKINPSIILNGEQPRLIDEWREEQSFKRTLERRPDLLEVLELTDKQLEIIEKIKSEM